MQKMRTAAIAVLATTTLAAQGQAPAPASSSLDDELIRHYQAVLRMDTTDPPGREQPVVDYLKQALEREGIPVEVFALEPHRPNRVARLEGRGGKRPLL